MSLRRLVQSQHLSLVEKSQADAENRASGAMQSTECTEPIPPVKRTKTRKNKAKKSLQWILVDPELAENAHTHAHKRDQSFSNAVE